MFSFNRNSVKSKMKIIVRVGYYSNRHLVPEQTRNERNNVANIFELDTSMDIFQFSRKDH